MGDSQPPTCLPGHVEDEPVMVQSSSSPADTEAGYDFVNVGKDGEMDELKGESSADSTKKIDPASLEKCGDMGTPKEESSGEGDARSDEHAQEELLGAESPSFFLFLKDLRGRVLRVSNINVIESVIAIRQLVSEISELQCDTCYGLRLVEADGSFVTLNDYAEATEYPSLKEGCTVEMVKTDYDVAAVRRHVRRIREILAEPPLLPVSPTVEVVEDPAKAELELVEEIEGDLSGNDSGRNSGGGGSKQRKKKKNKNKSNNGGGHAKNQQSSGSDKENGAGDNLKSPLDSERESTDRKEENPAGEERKLTKEEERRQAEELSRQLAEVQRKVASLEIPVPVNLSSFFDASEDTAVESAGENGLGGKNGAKHGKDKSSRRSASSSFSSSSSSSSVTSMPSVPECAKSICFSGYNPPPGYRRLQGDLAYLEVVVSSKETLHVTASVDGFFLNRSSSEAFDPSPARSGQQTFHCLLDLLKDSSPHFRRQLRALQEYVQLMLRDHSAYLSSAAYLSREAVAGGFGQHEPYYLERRRWLLPASNASSSSSNNSNSNNSAGEHRLDMNRTEEDLTSTFGMEERGIVRDWNDELQSCKELPRDTLKDRVRRSRVLLRVLSEFVDAATHGAVAILQGHFAPINPLDEPKAHVYVYNNIFFSYAADGRDTYKDMGGDVAAHVMAGRDLAGVLQFNEAAVEGLNTIATVLVDYLGARVVAQSVIPGILHGDPASTLVYGSVDNGKTLAWDQKMHTLMCEAGRRLRMTERTVQALGKDAEEEEEKQGERQRGALEEAEKAEQKEQLAAAAGKARKDATAAEEAWEGSSNLVTEPVPFCGPVDCKGIRGADGRYYILDLGRLTPKDPFFHKQKKNKKELSGSDMQIGDTEKKETAKETEKEKVSETEKEKVSETEKEQEQEDLDGLEFTFEAHPHTAVLRPELVDLYCSLRDARRRLREEQERRAKAAAESKASENGQGEAAETESAPKEQSEGEDGETSSKSGAEVEVKGSEEPKTKNSENSVDEKEDGTSATSQEEDQEAVKSKEKDGEALVPTALNTNLFMPYAASTDAEEASADEELVREVGDYLHKRAIPQIVKELCYPGPRVLDGAALTSRLHAVGVNVRYLGRIAALLLRMPRPASRFGLELVETEMVARAVKHILAQLLRENDKLRRKPGPLVVELLNCILGEVPDKASSKAAAGRSKNGGRSGGGKGAGKNKASKDAAGSVSASSASPVTDEEPSRGLFSRDRHAQGVTDVAALSLSSVSVWEEIDEQVKARFGYRLRLWLGKLGEAEGWAPPSKLPLLRRLCKQTGILLAARDYDLPQGQSACRWAAGQTSSSPSSSPSSPPPPSSPSQPFSSRDVLDLVPVVRSSLPAYPLADARELLQMAQHQNDAQNLPTALQLAHQSAVLVYEVSGGQHVEAARCCELVASISAESGDTQSALGQQQRAVHIYSQVCGSDHALTVTALGTLAFYHLLLSELDAAVLLLRRYVYLSELLVGPRFPRLAAIYYQLGVAMRELGLLRESLSYHHEALGRCDGDASQLAAILHSLAVSHEALGQFREALAFQRKCHYVCKAAFGETSPNTREAAAAVARFTQKAVEGAKGIKEKEAMEASEALAKEILAEEVALEQATKKTNGGSGKSAKKGKKGKAN